MRVAVGQRDEQQVVADVLAQRRRVAVVVEQVVDEAPEAVALAHHVERQRLAAEWLDHA